ncbi:DUF3780 domain-containing protein [Limnohabitans sp. DM1]|uniref:DUF3780 domain-containing protein n=1 Tax=Limnohabitans sp. DM1 TaxID=1597955 RepID=UPI000B17C4E8|nr:DUF3780 domain-containing protein [Limnohabitans sp. DM1]
MNTPTSSTHSAGLQAPAPLGRKILTVRKVAKTQPTPTTTTVAAPKAATTTAQASQGEPAANKIATPRKTTVAPTIKLTGFGASAAFGAHVFKLDLPAGNAGDVVLTEEFGYLAGLNGMPERETRACFPRRHWKPLGEAALKDFNARLRERKASIGKWNIGETLLDRMLGKELCVLLWAAEHAHPEQLDAICLRWTTLRPEERWWLYAMTAAQGGQAQDGERGWRKALFHALSDIGMSGQRQLMDTPQTFSLFDTPR